MPQHRALPADASNGAAYLEELKDGVPKRVSPLEDCYWSVRQVETSAVQCRLGELNGV